MDRVQTLYDQAIVSFRSRRFSEAIHQLQEVLTLDPQHLDALEALGVCFEKVGKLDQAIEAMKKLSESNRNHIMAHANLSRYYAEKGMILEAEQEQAEARRLSWKEELKVQKGEKGSGAAQKTPEQEARDEARDLEDRIARYKKVIALDPDDVLGFFSLGTALLDAKRLEEAKKAFETAVQVDPKHSPSYFSLGVALEALKLKSEAIAIYERGMPVADTNGDLIPLKKMQSRLHALRQEKD